jgi:AcrR family transcriptional regulator
MRVIERAAATISSEQKPSVARRKSSDDRRNEILNVAAELIVETRSLPLSMNGIGERMGASRALVYAHFSDQQAIAEALLARHLALLEDAGLAAATGTGDVVERGTVAAAIYLRHIVRHGPILHLILRDAPHGLTLSPRATLTRNRALRGLAGAARRQLQLSSAEALVLVELLIAIPEELGRLSHAGELELEDALGICQRLITSAIEAMRPR